MTTIKFLRALGFIFCVGGWFWMVREAIMSFTGRDNFEYALLIFLAGTCLYSFSSNSSKEPHCQESNKTGEDKEESGKALTINIKISSSNE